MDKWQRLYDNFYKQNDKMKKAYDLMAKLYSKVKK